MNNEVTTRSIKTPNKSNNKNGEWTNDFIAEMKDVNKSIETVRAKYGVVSGISSAWILDRFTLCIDLDDLISIL